MQGAARGPRPAAEREGAISRVNLPSPGSPKIARRWMCAGSSTTSMSGRLLSSAYSLPETDLLLLRKRRRARGPPLSERAGNRA